MTDDKLFVQNKSELEYERRSSFEVVEIVLLQADFMSIWYNRRVQALRVSRIAPFAISF